jgi:hypothetical protein
LIRITAKAESEDLAEALVADLEKEINSRLAEWLDVEKGD